MFSGPTPEDLMSKSQRRPPARRAQFKHFNLIPTRWMDNDVYGHVNNVVYYSYFDTVVNRYLIDSGGLDYHSGETIGGRNVIVRYPKRHLTEVLLSNRNDPEPYATAKAIAALFLQDTTR